VSLFLLVLATAMMCCHVRWVFFAGFGLLIISSFFAIKPHTSRRWPLRILSWFGWVAALLLFLWITSFGREPLPWQFAIVAVFSVGMSELDLWRAGREARNAA
jgi:hypothetical protein